MAIKEKNEAWIELSQAKGELIQTNNQLMEVKSKVVTLSPEVHCLYYKYQVINQKVKLGQQLESWQLDMQKLLEDQIETKLANNFGLTKF